MAKENVAFWRFNRFLRVNLSSFLELAEILAIIAQMCTMAQLLLYRDLLLRRNTDRVSDARWNLQFLCQIRGNSY
jgi:hypothetical protein